MDCPPIGGNKWKILSLYLIKMTPYQKFSNIFKPGDKVYYHELLTGEKNWGKILEIREEESDFVFELDEYVLEPMHIDIAWGLTHLSFTHYEYTLFREGFSQEKTKKNGDPFERGDKVWVYYQKKYIEGLILTTNNWNEVYPIQVVVYVPNSASKVVQTFTTDGKHLRNDKFKSLFHQKPE